MKVSIFGLGVCRDFFSNIIVKESIEGFFGVVELGKESLRVASLICVVFKRLLT
jgi:hypothetical protein